MKKNFKYVLGLVLVMVGFVLSSAQKENGSPAPLVTISSAVVMMVGGKIMSNEMKKGEGENDG
jgi:hypothetical protein